ncbi:hypothetical protein AB832_02530 [Flavobacteriaceae bacterium (ex Bugula neritina AB1)]|nr:hypothetical protein AB832_02530 [Flavobacteriaceae bacterium (ex Bugula neritina AB1)]
MNKEKLKKYIRLLLILIGVVALLSEIGTTTKNYYIQSIGVICLMIGAFFINTKLISRSAKQGVGDQEHLEEE